MNDDAKIQRWAVELLLSVMLMTDMRNKRTLDIQKPNSILAFAFGSYTDRNVCRIYSFPAETPSNDCLYEI